VVNLTDGQFRFSLPSRPLSPTIFSVGTGSSSPRVNWLGRDTNHSPPYRTDGYIRVHKKAEAHCGLQYQ
jgi:hypothetical protein